MPVLPSVAALPVSTIERAAHTLHISCSSHLAIINTCSEYLSRHLHLAQLVIVQCPQRIEIQLPSSE